MLSGGGRTSHGRAKVRTAASVRRRQRGQQELLSRPVFVYQGVDGGDVGLNVRQQPGPSGIRIRPPRRKFRVEALNQTGARMDKAVA